MKCGLSTINKVEERYCDKQSIFNKDKLFKKYASHINTVAIINNKCIDHPQNQKSMATEVVLTLPEQETNIRDDVNFKQSDTDHKKIHPENQTEKEPSLAGEMKNNSISKFTKEIYGQDDVISNEELSSTEEHLPHHMEEKNEKTLKEDSKVKHCESTNKLTHVALENNVSNEETKNNESDQLTLCKKCEPENNKVTKNNKSSQESADTLEKHDITNDPIIKKEKGCFKSTTDTDETILIDKKDTLHEDVREKLVDVKEQDDTHGQITSTRAMKSQEIDDSVVHEIPKEKIGEDLEYGKVEDKLEKSKEIDDIQEKTCNKEAKVTQKQDSPIMKDKINQDKSKEQQKTVVTVTKEKNVPKITNQNDEIQEIVHVSSSSEEETSDDENSEDSSDVVEVSDDSSNDETHHINKTLSSSCSSSTSDTEPSNSSCDSDIEEIKVVRTSCRKNINQNKKSKIKQRQWNRKNSNGDDLEILYEVDDKKCLLASQLVEVVYTNSLDTNENDSTLNWSENNDDAVEIIFEKEKVVKKKRRHGRSYSDLNEIHRSNKKKK